MPYGFILDVLFAGLLVATLVYVARLNRRLDALRAGREEFETLIKHFAVATEQAQANVTAMKAAAEGAGRGLQDEIDRARGLREDLAFLAERANGLADQLEGAISRGRAPATGNVARMTNVAAQPKPAAQPAAAAEIAPSAKPRPGPAAAPLTSGESELLRRLSTLR